MSQKPAILDTGIQLLVGLGNPGDEHDKTRHNAGFWFLDEAARAKHAAAFRNESKFHGEVSSIRHQGQQGSNEIRLLKPTTYMNNSGRSVAAVAKFYKIPVEAILVVHDELDLPPGTVRLKQGGGHGGHNGLRDMTALGSKNFWRLRIGIGHPGHKDKVHSYVLGRPAKGDKQQIDNSIIDALSVLDLILDGQMEKAMHELHTK